MRRVASSQKKKKKKENERKEKREERHEFRAVQRASRCHDSVKSRDTSPSPFVIDVTAMRKTRGKTAKTRLARLLAISFMYHRELSTLTVRSRYLRRNAGKNIWHGQIEATRSSTDFLRREFRNKVGCRRRASRRGKAREGNGAGKRTRFFGRVFLLVTKSG